MYNKIIIKTPNDQVEFDSNFDFIDGEDMVSLEFEENDNALSWFDNAITNEIFLKSISMSNNHSKKIVRVIMIKSITNRSVYLKK